MNWKVPLSDLNFDAAEVQAAVSAIESGWLSCGPRVAEFERAFAEAHGVEHVVAVNSGTAALHLACIAAGFGPGDEVLCPSLTFVATANAVRYCGATPVFVEIESLQNPLISIADCEKKITAKMRGIMVVHLAGCAAPMKELKQLCDKNNFALIEDAAHSPLSKTTDAMLGAIGNFGCFSFFPNKNMTTAEGGMLIAKEPEHAELARRLRSHGMTTATHERHQGQALSYDVKGLGFNYRLDEIRAAIGIEQLKKLPQSNEKRKQLGRRYFEQLKNCVEIEIPLSGYLMNYAFHIFPVLVKDEPGLRDATMCALKEKGIQTSVHYPPIHLMSTIRDDAGIDSPSLPLTEEYARRTITLPLFPTMTVSQQDYVCQSLMEILQP